MIYTHTHRSIYLCSSCLLSSLSLLLRAVDTSFSSKAWSLSDDILTSYDNEKLTVCYVLYTCVCVVCVCVCVCVRAWVCVCMLVRERECVIATCSIRMIVEHHYKTCSVNWWRDASTSSSLSVIITAAILCLFIRGLFLWAILSIPLCHDYVIITWLWVMSFLLWNLHSSIQSFAFY